MTPHPAADDPRPLPTPRFRHGLAYLVATLAFLAVVVWVTLDTVRQTPTREVTTDLGPYGLVTIQLTTDPYPALPTGTVRLHFMPMDSRQRPVSLDSVRFEYGREGSDQPVGSDQAAPMPDGRGMFMAGARFSYVGTWWLRLIVSKGDEQAEARFTVDVEPAQ